MSVIFLLLTISTLVAGVFLFGFIWAVRKGQYDDDRSPAVRILLDDDVRLKDAGTSGRTDESLGMTSPRSISSANSRSLTPIHPLFISDCTPDNAIAKTTTP